MCRLICRRSVVRVLSGRDAKSGSLDRSCYSKERADVLSVF